MLCMYELLGNQRVYGCAGNRERPRLLMRVESEIFGKKIAQITHTKRGGEEKKKVALKYSFILHQVTPLVAGRSGCNQFS